MKMFAFAAALTVMLPLHVSSPPPATADTDLKVAWCRPVVEREIAVQDPHTYDNLTPDEIAAAQYHLQNDCTDDPPAHAADLVDRGIIVIDQ